MTLTPPEPHLLDTSAVILMMRLRVSASTQAQVPFATYAELLAGVERALHRTRELAKIRATLGTAEIVYPDRQTLSIYARVSAYLQRIGQPVPINDLWNATLTLQWDLPLLADDAHFARVPNLKFIPAR